MGIRQTASKPVKSMVQTVSCGPDEILNYKFCQLAQTLLRLRLVNFYRVNSRTLLTSLVVVISYICSTYGNVSIAPEIGVVNRNFAKEDHLDLCYITMSGLVNRAPVIQSNKLPCHFLSIVVAGFAEIPF